MRNRLLYDYNFQWSSIRGQTAIAKARETALAILNNEAALFHQENIDIGYMLWHDSLSPVRRHFSHLILEHNPSWPNLWHYKGHKFDHHMHGFIAPLEIFRKGFLGVTRNPVQQLTCLNRYLAEHDCRFIYVALPCKKALYPEIIVPPEIMPPVPNIIPQWRKMLRDLLLAGVEVIDMLPVMGQSRKKLENDHPPFPMSGDVKKEAFSLFSFYHDISPIGADVISSEIASYLALTTPEIEIRKYQGRPVVFMEDNCYWQTEWINKPDIKEQSEIGIFGNCNLQKYLGSGFDITSKLAAKITQPVEYCGRILPFAPNWRDALADVRDGLFFGKKILIYLGFPSAAYVRSPQFPGQWAADAFPERFFYPRV